MRIKLSEADRERLGAPEWVTYDPTVLMLDEAIEIQDATGYGPDELADALRGQPLVRDGQPVLRPDGSPRIRRDLRAWQAAVWVALRRSGVNVPLRGLTFDLFGVDTAPDEDDDQGKAEADPSTPPTTSAG